MPDHNKPEAAGCRVSKADTPFIIASVACYGAFVVFGACVAALGAALPSLADATGKSTAAFGIAFTTRGVGYMIGTLASAWILNFKNIPVSKQFMTCAALAITGVATGIISDLRSFTAMLILFFIQGIGFGGIDVMANCVMPELWGSRVQPWMQALHSCFGVGAIIGPSLVGSIGHRGSFIIISVFSFFPLAGLFAVYIHDLKTRRTHDNKGDTISTGDPPISPSSVAAGAVNSPLHGHGHGNPPDRDMDAVESPPSPAESPLDAEVPGVAVPLSLKLLITAFYFVYVGVESGFAGWIPTFALQEGVTTSESQAAYLSAYFWAALTAGRLLAIVVAVYVSATTMLRSQLLMASVCVVMILGLADTTYSNCAGVSAFYGFSLSAVFPLAMTIVADYGYTMDAATTTLFMVSSTLGESIVPVGIGFAISHSPSGAMSLSYITFACTLAMVLIYCGMHYIGGGGGDKGLFGVDWVGWLWGVSAGEDDSTRLLGSDRSRNVSGGGGGKREGDLGTTRSSGRTCDTESAVGADSSQIEATVESGGIELGSVYS